MRGWAWIAAILLAVPALGAQGLLPNRFSGWQAAGSGAGAAMEPPTSAGDAALYKDCQQQSIERQVYQHDGATITVTLRRLGDPSYAYSAFSVLRPVPASDFRPTPHSAVGNDQAMLLIGDLIVNIRGANLAADAHDFSALAADLQSHASIEPYPTIWQYLPVDRLVQHSDRYALDPQTFQRELLETQQGDWPAGDWVGFSHDDAESEVARYGFGKQRATLVLLSYPTPEIAAAHIGEMRQWFDVNPTPRAANGKPVVYTRRIGSLVGLVAGAPDSAAAASLLGQIRYQTVVTWNAPGFRLHELTMGDYVVGSIMGTGALLVIALTVGIALGMVRVGVKHFLPGLVFDRHRSVEIIQLGISSKPIDARDFY